MLVFACNRSQDEPARATPQDSATVATTASAPPHDSATAATTVSAPPAPTPRSPVKVYGSETTSIAAKPGERFVVALPGSTAIPYEWKLEGAPDVGILALTEEGNTESPPTGCDGCGGYAGAFTFTFDVKGAGTARLHFVYRRVAPPGSAKTKDVTIEVHVAKSS